MRPERESHQATFHLGEVRGEHCHSCDSILPAPAKHLRRGRNLCSSHAPVPLAVPMDDEGGQGAAAPEAGSGSSLDEVRAALIFRAGMQGMRCTDASHGDAGHQMPFEAASILTHLALCKGEDFASLSMVHTVMREAVLGCIRVLDKTIVHCGHCKNLLNGSVANMRKHFQECLHFSLNPIHIAATLKPHGLETVSYSAALNLSCLPQTKAAIIAGHISSQSMLACPAAGCLSAFETGNRKGLLKHLRDLHTRTHKARAMQFKDIASDVRPCLVATWGKNRHVRFTDEGTPPHEMTGQAEVSFMCACWAERERERVSESS